MAATSPCVPCCTTPQSVNVPGVQGNAGADGTDGNNAYTTLTLASAVPAAVGDQITVTVANSGWMVVGQIVVIDGPASFEVVQVLTATTAILEWKQYPGDVAALTALALGATVAPAGVLNTLSTLSVYASGTVATLPDTTAAVLNFGTTDPTLTITAAGTYLLLSRAVLNYAAWKSTAQNVNLRLYRNNNTPAALTNATTVFAMINSAAAAITYSLGSQVLPAIIYTTANNNDQIELQGWTDAAPSVSGTIESSAAEIVAIRIA